VLKSQERGRIWRIVPDGQYQARKPQMSKMNSKDLVPLLADPNFWWRLNAQRVLVERREKTGVWLLWGMGQDCPFPPGRAHALWTLQGLNSFQGSGIVDLTDHLWDGSPLVRVQALRLAEKYLNQDRVQARTLRLADDPSTHVRLQAAFSLGTGHGPAIVLALGRLIRRDGNDPWITSA